jgi:hypothetical protein
MSIPPCLLYLRINNEEHHFGLWLPLFLAWIILAALLIALLPIFLIVLIVSFAAGWGEFFLKLGPQLYNVLCALKGLKVDVDRTNEKVEITFV